MGKYKAYQGGQCGTFFGTNQTHWGNLWTFGTPLGTAEALWGTYGALWGTSEALWGTYGAPLGDI